MIPPTTPTRQSTSSGGLQVTALVTPRDWLSTFGYELLSRPDIIR